MPLKSTSSQVPSAMQLLVTRLRMCPRVWATSHRLCGCTVQSHTCLTGLSQAGNYFRELAGSSIGASSAVCGVCVSRDIFSWVHLVLFISFTLSDLYFVSWVFSCCIHEYVVLKCVDTWLDLWTLAVRFQPKKFYFISVWVVMEVKKRKRELMPIYITFYLNPIAGFLLQEKLFNIALWALAYCSALPWGTKCACKLCQLRMCPWYFRRVVVRCPFAMLKGHVMVA